MIRKQKQGRDLGLASRCAITIIFLFALVCYPLTKLSSFLIIYLPFWMLYFAALQLLGPGDQKRRWVYTSFGAGLVALGFALFLRSLGVTIGGSIAFWFVGVGIQGNIIELAEALYSKPNPN